MFACCYLFTVLNSGLLFSHGWLPQQLLSSRDHSMTKIQYAVGDSRLRPRCCHLANWTKHTLRFYSSPFISLCENIMLSTKPEVHYVFALPSEEDRSRAAGNVQTIGEIWTCGFWDMRADRQTGTPIAILLTPAGGEVTSRQYILCTLTSKMSFIAVEQVDLDCSTSPPSSIYVI